MINVLKNIKQSYKVNIVFIKTKYDAYYCHNRQTIFINLSFKNNFEKSIQIIFHELGHKYCFDNSKYYNYHHETNLRLIKLTALKAERYVDRWAKKEFQKFNFDFEYCMFYYEKSRTKLFKKYISKKFSN